MNTSKYLVYTVARRELTHSLKRADPAFFEDALRFLEDDPRTFGSGYVKERIWHYITRYPLASGHIRRLEAAAFNYLFRPMSREFRRMCLTMSRIATPEFWKKVSEQAALDQGVTTINARCLLPYAESIAVGEQARLKSQHEQRRLRWSREPAQSFSSLTTDIFMERLQRAECWPEGIVHHKSPDPDDMPILRYTNELDAFLTSISWPACDHNVMLPELEATLKKTQYELGYNDSIWVYVLYILSRIGDERAVSIVSTYLDERVSHRFESVTKDMLMRAGLKVLHHYDSVEARQSIVKYREYDQEFLAFYQTRRDGWINTYP